MTRFNYFFSYFLSFHVSLLSLLIRSYEIIAKMNGKICSGYELPQSYRSTIMLSYFTISFLFIHFFSFWIKWYKINFASFHSIYSNGIIFSLLPLVRLFSFERIFQIIMFWASIVVCVSDCLFVSLAGWLNVNLS